MHVLADVSSRSEQDILADVDRVARGFEISDTTIQIEAEGFHAKQNGTGASDPENVHSHEH